jgi:hypothetical protein
VVLASFKRNLLPGNSSQWAGLNDCLMTSNKNYFINNEPVYIYTKFLSNQSLYTQVSVCSFTITLIVFIHFCCFIFEIWDTTVALVCQNLF